jgi:ribosome biogenesis GTPase / thiamine phosphate phosphatase
MDHRLKSIRDSWHHYQDRMHTNEESKALWRVIAEHRSIYTVVGIEERQAVVRGNFHLTGEFPKVGDWVRCSPAEDGLLAIETILPRMTEIARKASGSDTKQVIATNVDTMCIVQGLDGDFNERRLERYLILARHSGCTPLAVLTKADVATDQASVHAAIAAIDPTLAIVTLSAHTGEGIVDFERHLTPGSTSVLVGSSGAGKSTLLNKVLGEELQATAAVRSFDNKGRHTTTHRELFVLPSGALVIDTPGMRELGVIADTERASEETYEHIAQLARTCRFRDCDHVASAGCALQEAIEAQEITAQAVAGYLKVLREEAFQRDRQAHEESIIRRTKAYEKIKKEQGEARTEA